MAVLAVGVGFFFLRDWRATVISAISLPLSILPAFAAMYWFGYSLNTLTLLALHGWAEGVHARGVRYPLDAEVLEPGSTGSEVQCLERWLVESGYLAVTPDPIFDEVTAAARGTQNLLYPMKEALRAGATLGEVADVLREVFGVYQPS